MSLRLRFLGWLKDRLGADVLWAQKGPAAFDCSGLVTCGLLALGGPDWRATHNTDRLWAELEPTETPEPGDFAFWWAPGADAPAKGDVEHVAVVCAGGLILTADGATHSITTLDAARQAHAVVRLRESVHYRKRFAGYRRFPLVNAGDSVALACGPKEA